MLLNSLKKKIYKSSMLPKAFFGGAHAPIAGRLMVKDQIIWLNVLGVDGEIRKIS